MEKTRLPAGGRTAANIHPGQAEKDLERNSRSDGHACTGGKHALSMPEEPFAAARIISIARIRGTTVKARPGGTSKRRNGPGSRARSGPLQQPMESPPGLRHRRTTRLAIGSISETGISNTVIHTRPFPHRRF